jgi:hypothetical protein
MERKIMYYIFVFMFILMCIYQETEKSSRSERYRGSRCFNGFTFNSDGTE